MKLIVNADDYGMDSNVSRAIVDCFRRGWLTQTTLMVNMPGSEEAVELSHENHFFNKVGLHINLSEGWPLTDEIRRCRYFCDETGMFNNKIRTLLQARFILPAMEKKAVAKEISAQMEKFQSWGFPMRHYDSHGHVGAYLSILPTALACGKKYGFKTTRHWINLSGSHRDIPMTLSKRVYANIVGGTVARAGFRHSDYLGWAWDIRRLPKELDDDVVVEILCHPMYAINDPSMEENECVEKVDQGGVLIDTFHLASNTIGELTDLAAKRITYSEL